MYRVFYPVGDHHWQDTLRRFRSLDRAIAFARTWERARVTDKNLYVVCLVEPELAIDSRPPSL